jgi:hypothetical protein
MATIANMTLTNQAAANFVLEPLMTQPFAQWIYRGSTTAEGNWLASSSLSTWTKQRPTNRVVQKLYVPIEQTVNGIVVVTHYNEMAVTFNIHKDSTAQQKLDFGALARDFIQEAAIKAYYETHTPSF